VTFRLTLAQVWIDDTSDLTMTQLRERAHQMVERHHIALLIVDHLHLIRTSAHEEGLEYRLEELGEIHRSLKMMAYELTIPVVVFVPLARILACRHTKRHWPAQLQRDQRRKLPARGDRSAVFGQVGHVHQRPVRSSGRERSGNAPHVQSQQ